MKPALFTRPLAHQAADFWQLFETSTCAVQRRRAQFFALLAERRPLAEILALIRYSRVTAYSLVNRYHTLGLESLADGRQTNTGAPPVLTADEQQRLARHLHEDFERGMVSAG
ncbi:helix-turn-helix domain-containing protein, partial [Deinococcus frigens]|uniref:helix-turn-helix domain-containing protein n=1 Tax=Deinococcus frigens TaxID=249403 RepID=UPI00138E4035